MKEQIVSWDALGAALQLWADEFEVLGEVFVNVHKFMHVYMVAPILFSNFVTFFCFSFSVYFSILKRWCRL